MPGPGEFTGLTGTLWEPCPPPAPQYSKPDVQREDQDRGRSPLAVREGPPLAPKRIDLARPRRRFVEPDWLRSRLRAAPQHGRTRRGRLAAQARSRRVAAQLP